MTRLLIVSPYPLFPALAGGKIRILSLACGLQSCGLQVDLLTPFAFGQSRAIPPGFPCPIRQIPYPFVWALLTDRPFPYQFLTSFHPGLSRLARPRLEGYDYIQFDHVQFASLLDHIPDKTRVIYDAQNVEYDYARGESLHLPRLLSSMVSRRMARCEARMVERAHRILVVSQADGERFQELYGCPPQKFISVPNGVQDALADGSADRLWLRCGALQGYSRVLLFSGANVEHNREAVRQLFRHLVPQITGGVALVVQGTVAQNWLKRRLPPHVFLDIKGPVEDYAAIHTIGLNPVSLGGGTNLKLLHYLSLGMKAVSTDFGMRGHEWLRDHVKIAKLSEFWSAVNSELPDPPPVQRLQQKLSWSKITEELAGHYRMDALAIEDGDARPRRNVP